MNPFREGSAAALLHFRNEQSREGLRSMIEKTTEKNTIRCLCSFIWRKFNMLEKVLSFLFTLGLIGWNIFDIANGRGNTFTWIMLSFFSLVGLCELGMIFEAKKKAVTDNNNSQSSAQ